MQSPQDLPRATVTEDESEYVFFGSSAREHIFHQLDITQRFYERELLQYLSSLCRPGDLVVDVGANLGNHTVYFAGALDCEVVAFEAVPETTELLVRNITANFLDGKVLVQPYAVGVARGRASVVSSSETNSGSTALREDPEGTIRVVALDDMTWPRPPRLIKVDVEGMDLDVLRGARETIRVHQPYLSVEAVDAEAEAALREYLASIGYGVLGTFNATPTFVCAPVSGEGLGGPRLADLYGLLDGLTRKMQDIDLTIARSNRYAQRVHKEIMERADQMALQKPTVPPADGSEPTPVDEAPEVHQLLEVVAQLRQENAQLRSQLAALQAIGSRAGGA